MPTMTIMLITVTTTMTMTLIYWFQPCALIIHSFALYNDDDNPCTVVQAYLNNNDNDHSYDATMITMKWFERCAPNSQPGPPQQGHEA